MAHSHSRKPDDAARLRLTDQGIACRLPFQESPASVPAPFVTLHYVNTTDIPRLTQLVEHGCNDKQPQ